MLLFRFFRLVYTIFLDWKAPSKKSETQGPGFRSLRYAQHEYQLTGASPERALIAGIAQPKARVSIVRWNLKEAGGKHLA